MLRYSLLVILLPLLSGCAAKMCEAPAVETAAVPPPEAEVPVITASAKAFRPALRPGWYIQLGQYKDKVEAEIDESSSNYRHLKPQVTAKGSKPDLIYLLVAGPFSRKSYAERNLTELKAEKIPPSLPGLVYVLGR